MGSTMATLRGWASQHSSSHTSRLVAASERPLYHRCKRLKKQNASTSCSYRLHWINIIMRDRFILVVNWRMLLVVPVSSKSYQCLFPVRNLSFWFGWFEWKMPFVWEFSCWFFCKSTFCCWWVSELHGSHLGSLQAGLQRSSHIFFHIYGI